MLNLPMCFQRTKVRYQLIYSAMVVLVLFQSGQTKESRTVKIASGYVRGYKDPNLDIFTFYSIPYATVPKGSDKFKAPLPAPRWMERLDAIDRGIICPQSYGNDLKFARKPTMQEDCLIANVYTPNTSDTTEETNMNKTLLPVMVHVHGGAYQHGYGDMYTPKHLVQSKNIIVVNFNYRLNAHGFLCLGTEDVPGNAGMKDQVALLRWVKRNIASFGGNPEDVTIVGYSSGSSSVELLMLSKIARGLFNKVVLQSASTLGPWSVQMDPIKIAIDHAKKYSFKETNDIYALEFFYKTADFRKLNVLWAHNADNTFRGFVPCIERKTGGEITFLDDAPVNIFKSGDYKKLPILYGINSNEGPLNKNNTISSNTLPADLQFTCKKEKQKVAQKIRKFYSEDKAYNHYLGDIMYTYPTLRAVKLHIEAGHNKIYLYDYAYGDAEHSAQNRAIMDENNENILSEDYKKVKAVMRELLVNFITTGEPAPANSTLPAWWPVTGADGSPHMLVNSSLHMRGPVLQSRAHFWHSIYEEHYRRPIPPSEPTSLVKDTP